MAAPARSTPRSARAGRRAAGGAPGTRGRLLAAAGQVFAARGYRGATMREIAARAATNLAAAHYHFGSKEGLYLEVAREHFEALERRLVERGAAAADADLAARSRAELVALLRVRIQTMLASFLEDDPIHAALMQRELLDPSRALPVIVRRWVDPQRRAMGRILQRLAPELAPEQIERCTRSVVGQVVFYLTHRPALLLLMGRRAWPAGFVAEAADHVAEFTLGGIDRIGRRRSRSASRARQETSR
jgi:AcrR family transcriptional regulator